MSRLRRSFALRLFAGTLALVVLVMAGVSFFLLVRQHRETVASAQNTADNRAETAREFLLRVVLPETQTAARDLAGRGAVVGGLRPGGDLTALATVLAAVDAGPTARLAVLDPGGAVAGTTDGGPAVTPEATALASRAVTQRAEQVAVTADTAPALLVAVPVLDAGSVSGVVVDTVLLAPQLERLSAVVGYPLVFVPSSRPAAAVVTSPDGTAAPAGVGGGLLGTAAGGVPVSQVVGGPDGDHAVSLVPVSVASAGAPAAAIGVSVPLSTLTGDERGTAVTILLMALICITVSGLFALVFVDRFVRRPVAALERGVTRIAAGDYTTAVDVTSPDELGSLAHSVNAMREAIAGHAAQLESLLGHLGAVSAALTTTASGVGPLAAAVASSAIAIAGEGSAAAVLGRDGEALAVRASAGRKDVDWGRTASALDGGLGDAPPAAADPLTPLVVLPLRVEDRSSGALCVAPPIGRPLSATGRTALETLANNAGIALDHARLFEQEQDTVRRLRELERLRSEFLNNAHHELRTPLTAVLGAADIAQEHWEEMDPQTRAATLGVVGLGTRRLAAVVESLLEFTVLSTENVPLHRRAVAVRPAVLGALERIRHRQSTPPPAVEVRVGEDVHVDADPLRLAQALEAVLDNAVKFTPDTGRIEVEAFAEEGGAPVTTIVVRDTGVGVEAAKLPLVFEGFYQAESGFRRRFGGLGMGLAIVERICDLHHARVTIESEAGRGTTVRLQWPSAGGAALPARTAPN